MSPTGSYECRVPAQGGENLHTASILILTGKDIVTRSS
jgi:hypothetical protein